MTRHVEDLQAVERLPTQGLRPVQVWSFVGACFVVLQLYVYGRWLWDGPKRTPAGDSPMPGWMPPLIHGFEVISWVIGAVMVWFLLIRPWIRERRIGLDGMLVLVFPTVFWQDTLANYTQLQVGYNSEAFNLGSWYAYIPGWLMPKGNQSAEALWVLPAYVYWFLGSSILAGAAMHRARRNWPDVSIVRLVVCCYLVMVAFDSIIEIVWLRMGMYTYTSTIDWLTLFHGHYYQFPIYEVLVFAASMCAIACVRSFRDDRGYTVAERGADEVTTNNRKRFTLRFLALVGIMNACYLSYNLVFQWTGTHVTDTTPDISNRSYFTNQICGAGSGDPEIACPGKHVPIPRIDAPQMRVDGTFTHPG